MLGDQPLQLSTKARLLLTYLTLEGSALHRETVAELLWPQGGGLANLRVELSKLRALGVDLSPQRAPLLRLTHHTDLEALETAVAGAGPLPDTWLDGLPGEPLEGWDDPLPPALQPWLKAQRQRLRGLVGNLLQRAWNRARDADQTVLADQIMARAVSLGYTLSQHRTQSRRLAPLGDPPPSEDLLTAWLTGELRPDVIRALQAAEEAPQILLYVGRPGSGCRAALKTVLHGQDWLALHLGQPAHPALVITSLLLQLLRVVPAQRQADVRALLEQSGTPQETLQRLVPLLLDLGPLVVTLRVGELGVDGFGDLLNFAMNWPLPLLLVLIITPETEDDVRQRLARHQERILVSRVPLFPATAPVDALAEQNLYQLVRHSEGSPAAARSLLTLARPLPPRLRLTERVRAMLLAEVRALLPGHSAALAALAGLPGPFTGAAAGKFVADLTPDLPELLRQALHTRVLERVPPVIEVSMPGAQVRLPDGEHALAFRSELQRSALAATLDSARRSALRDVPPALRFPVLPAPSPLRSQVQLHPAQVSPLSCEPGRSLLLPGGYHLHVQPSRTSVLRLGALGHQAPALHLRYLPPPTATSWRVVFRIDEFRAETGTSFLNVLTGQGTTVLNLTPHRLDWIPGVWQELSGPLEPPGAPLQLVIRTIDLILHVSEVQFEDGE